MMHTSRRWQVAEVSSAEELAEMISAGRTWTLCSGFSVAGYPDYLFLNDSTSEDAAAEYAVIHGGLAATHHRQIETITFSWCSVEQGLEYIRHVLDGKYDESNFAHDIEVRIETSDEHGSCPRCM